MKLYRGMGWKIKDNFSQFNQFKSAFPDTFNYFFTTFETRLITNFQSRNDMNIETIKLKHFMES